MRSGVVESNQEPDPVTLHEIPSAILVSHMLHGEPREVYAALGEALGVAGAQGGEVRA